MTPKPKVVSLDRTKSRLQGGNGNGGNIGERLAVLETKIDFLATKADMEQAINSAHKWFNKTLIAACGVGFAALTLMVTLLIYYFSTLGEK